MKKLAGFLKTTNLSAKIVTAAISLFMESCINAFFWLFGWIAAFICLWVAGYSSFTITLVFWLGATVLYLIGLSRFVVPKRADILRRVEIASDVKHRPLVSLKDIRISLGREEMWELEKDRQKTLLSKLRHSKPDLQLSRRDPFALRIAFILLLICAVFVMPSDIGPRIKAGLLLKNEKNEVSASVPFAQIKIIPPAYSGLKTIFLSGKSKPLDILAGSTIQADVQKDWGVPKLKMGTETITLKQKDKTDLWTVEARIPRTDSIKITTFGIPRFSRKINWHEDTPPIIGWNGEIEVLPTGEMRIPLKIADDFGVNKLTLRAILAADEEIPFFGSPLSMEKKMNLSIRGSTDIKPVFDTTGHVWAGKRASIIVEAEDFAGNVSETSPITVTLPERNFRNPLASQLASIRYDLLNMHGVISNITDNIEAILYNPELYNWDTVVTLGLRSIDSRLHYDHEKESLESSASMMWSLALRLEDGRISETQTSLREALEKLQEAVQKGADKAELAALMQQVQQALVQHLQNLAQKLQQNGQMPPVSAEQKTLSVDALSSFLQKLQDDLAKGNSQSALQKLNELQQLADMLGSSAAQGMPKEMQEMMQNLEDLQNLIARQKSTMDKTREGNSEDVHSLSKEQKDIEAQAKGIADKVGNNKPLNDAQGEMSQSSGDLDKADMASSASHQQKALDLLNNAAQSMQQALQKKMQNMMSLSLGDGGSQDPLGRSIRDDGTRIPEGAARKKSDTIIKTLREREGDMKRPLEERNYYQRLLKQW